MFLKKNESKSLKVITTKVAEKSSNVKYGNLSSSLRMPHYSNLIFHVALL